MSASTTSPKPEDAAGGESPLVDADLLAGAPASAGATPEGAPPPLLDLLLLGGRVRRWSGILGSFFGVQALVQGAGLAAGLLFVNFLPIDEFAFYTLASSVLVTLSFATDLGSGSALLHFFHRAAREGVESSPHLAAILSLRRALFALGALLAALAIWAWSAQRALPVATATIAVGLVLATVWFQIPATLGVLQMRLEDRYVPSYRAEGAGALARLLLAAAAIAIGWRSAPAALATALVGAALTALLVRGALRHAPAGYEALRAARRSVARYLVPTLPGALYFAIQGQLVVWLAAAFGGTTNLAEVGALGRLGLLIGFFSGLAPVVFLPRLARLTDESLFRRRYLQFGVLLVALAAVLVAAALVAPRAFLALLGPGYRGLEGELLLVVASSGLTLLGGYAVAVNNARSWTRWQVGAVAFLFVWQAALAAVLPLDTTRGILLFGLGSNAAGLLAQSLIALGGFARPKWVSW